MSLTQLLKLLSSIHENLTILIYELRCRLVQITAFDTPTELPPRTISFAAYVAELTPAKGLVLPLFFFFLEGGGDGMGS